MSDIEVSGPNPAGRCASCDARIVWSRTKAGKAMPLNYEPVDDGNVVLNGRRYVSHFVTCKFAAQHRRRTPTAQGGGSDADRNRYD